MNAVAGYTADIHDRILLEPSDAERKKNGNLIISLNIFPPQEILPDFTEDLDFT